jgi:hypothetical protein
MGFLLFWFLGFGSRIGFCADTGNPKSKPENPKSLLAGAAALSITPKLDRSVFLAGFDANRPAASVHDELMARALVLELNGKRVALVGLDLIGLPNHRIRAIRSRLKKVSPSHVVIASTHVHSGPDTLGLWGPSPTQTGRDPQYLDWLEARVAETIDQAASALRPATLRLAQTEVPDGLAVNIRERGLQDRTLTALQLRDRKGATISTLVNYACHPEVMRNGSFAMTADFCGATMREVERAFGGVGIYLNGALGGMVTTDGQTNRWEEVDRIGTGIGRVAVQALRKARQEPPGHLDIQSRLVELPLENERFRAAVMAGLLELPETGTNTRRPGEAGIETERETSEAKSAVTSSVREPPKTMSTEVTLIRLGNAAFVTVPGELLPRPGLALRAALKERYRFIIGLGQDELGYILDPADFDRQLYRYERSMSVGKQTWPILFQALQDLMT